MTFGLEARDARCRTESGLKWQFLRWVESDCSIKHLVDKIEGVKNGVTPNEQREGDS